MMMMKRVRNALALAAVSALMPAMASATVLTFDDLTGKHFFTANYDGFEFGNNDIDTNPWYWTNTRDSQYGTASGSTYITTDFSLYDGSTLQATLPISSTTAFVFNGAYFSGYDTVEYKLYLGGVLVYTSAPSAELTPTATYFASGYSSLVDSVVILGTQGFFAVDNFTYNQQAVAVPEPGAAALMLAGLAGLVAFKRKAKGS